MHVNKTNKYHQTRNLTIAPIDLSLGGQETPICPLSTLSVIAFFLPPRGIYLGGVEWFERGDRERSISWRSQERGPRNPHCIFDTPLSVLYSRAVCILAITLAYQRFTDGYIRRQNMANLACLLGLFFFFFGSHFWNGALLYISFMHTTLAASQGSRSCSSKRTFHFCHC